MAIVPKRRTSKTRKRKRRTHYKLEVPGMTLCPNCGEMKLSHNVCKVCGYYGGKQVINKAESIEEPQVEEKPKKRRRKKVEDAEEQEDNK